MERWKLRMWRFVRIKETLIMKVEYDISYFNLSESRGTTSETLVMRVEEQPQVE